MLVCCVLRFYWTLNWFLNWANGWRFRVAETSHWWKMPTQGMRLDGWNLDSSRYYLLLAWCLRSMSSATVTLVGHLKYFILTFPYSSESPTRSHHLIQQWWHVCFGPVFCREPKEIKLAKLYCVELLPSKPRHINSTLEYRVALCFRHSFLPKYVPDTLGTRPDSIRGKAASSCGHRGSPGPLL